MSKDLFPKLYFAICKGATPKSHTDYSSRLFFRLLMRHVIKFTDRISKLYPPPLYFLALRIFSIPVHSLEISYEDLCRYKY